MRKLALALLLSFTAIGGASATTYTSVTGAGLSWEFPTEESAWTNGVNTCPVSFPVRCVAREDNGRFIIIRFPAGSTPSGAAQWLSQVQNYHGGVYCIEGIDFTTRAKLPYHAITLVKEYTPPVVE